MVARGLGAMAVLVTGAVHLDQYFGPYRAIPTIGTLFIVNFVAATVIGVALLAPIEHLAGRSAGAAIALVTRSWDRPHRGLVRDAVDQRAHPAVRVPGARL